MEVDAASVAMACALEEIRSGFLKRLLGLVIAVVLSEEDAVVMVVVEEQWRGRRAAGKEWDSGVAPVMNVDLRSRNWSFDAMSISLSTFDTNGE